MLKQMYNFYRLSTTPDHVRMLHLSPWHSLVTLYPGIAGHLFFPTSMEQTCFPRHVRKVSQLPFCGLELAVLQALRLEFIFMLRTWVNTTIFLNPSSFFFLNSFCCCCCWLFGVHPQARLSQTGHKRRINRLLLPDLHIWEFCPQM